MTTISDNYGVFHMQNERILINKSLHQKNIFLIVEAMDKEKSEKVRKKKK